MYGLFVWTIFVFLIFLHHQFLVKMRENQRRIRVLAKLPDVLELKGENELTLCGHSLKVAEGHRALCYHTG